MGFFRNKEEKNCSCSCNCTSQISSKRVQNENTNKESRIKILGSGCEKCKALEESVKEALNELHMDIAIDHVTDFSQIAAYGVMITPALVVDNKVLSCGRTLNKNEARIILEENIKM